MSSNWSAETEIKLVLQWPRNSFGSKKTFANKTKRKEIIDHKNPSRKKKQTQKVLCSFSYENKNLVG